MPLLLFGYVKAQSRTVSHYPVTVVRTPPAQPLSPGPSSPPSLPGTRLDLMIFQQHWSKILPAVPLPAEHGPFPPSSAL
ncbi:unnamed protein product [Rangifer tarandus platyrhynchus]|uniref:Uncharacterized protein n=1 Tax=Rangifer tarandus platyrhynchus TaxID=3082113 RepID=A0AC59ZFR2_RANTA